MNNRRKKVEKLAGPKKAKLVRRSAPLTRVFVNVEQLIPDGKFVLTCDHHKVLQLREMTE